MCAIKYIYLLLSTILVLASCSGSKVDDLNKIEFNNGNDGKATFNDLRHDMIRHIATFIEPEDIVNWRYVNCLTLSSLSLKRLVQQNFSISGLESIADNEAELAGVMRFAYICHDHLLLFKAFMKEVVWEKKPYVCLFSPLMLHLLRTFRELGAREKQEYQHYFKRKFKNNFECYMINACFKKDRFDIVLEIVKDNAYLSNKALERAARLGHIMIVEILLQNRNVFPADKVGKALRNAVVKKRTSIVEILLQNRDDIPADDVGKALRNATGDGSIAIVELLFQNRNDIPADDVGKALRNATGDGSIAIVELLFQNRNDIPADDVGEALRDAARCGNNAIFKLIIHHLKDI